MKENILIFEAHSDDAVIGMGGYILRFRDKYNFILVTMTRGETAYPTEDLKGHMDKIRREESIKADRVLGIKDHIFLDNPCQDFHNDLANYHRIIELIRKYRPIRIFTHKSPSKHRDHRNVHDVVVEGWWKASERVLIDLGEPYRCPDLWLFEVTDLFEFPDIIVDISEYYEEKQEALKQFMSQFSVLPGIERFVEGLALVRGYQGGVVYGEAFKYCDFLSRVL